MTITITGHHVEVTDAIREAVNSKLAKLNKHFPDISNLQVILTVEKHAQSAEVITHYLGQDFAAKAKNTDMYQAIAEVTQKLNGVLLKQKEKVKAHGHDKPELQEDIAEAV